MSAHTHSQFVEGCYRCDLGADEVLHALRVDAGADAIVAAWVEGMHPMMKPFMEDEEHREQAIRLAEIVLLAAGRVEVSQTHQAEKETK